MLQELVGFYQMRRHDVIKEAIFEEKGFSYNSLV